MFLLLLTSCGPTAFRKVKEDGLTYFIDRNSSLCFVSGWTWDGNEEHMTITIPDTVQGYKVTQLGGYAGGGNGWDFCIMPPAERSEAFVEWTLNKYLNEYKVVDMNITLILGKNVSKLEKIHCKNYTIGLDEKGERVCYMPYVYVICDDENETFYSKDGKLYYRSNYSLVDEFNYR